MNLGFLFLFFPDVHDSYHHGSQNDIQSHFDDKVETEDGNQKGGNIAIPLLECRHKKDGATQDKNAGVVNRTDDCRQGGC